MEYVITPKNGTDPIKFFLDISKIPRGSGKEKLASDYLLNFIKENNHWGHQDSFNNIYAKKEGVGSKKNNEPILFQGHIDMVWEKNADTDFDFETQGLNLYEKDGWLKAKGTTLGADNGVAIAYMMSLLADKTLEHPPLEFLLTTEEETGLLGANNVDMSHFSAKKLVNIDAGPEGVFLTSSAGGVRTDYEQEFSRVNLEGSYKPIKISITGLNGGHSGVDINKELGNSLKIGARVLYELKKQLSVSLASFNGGEMDNAIPREAFITAYVSNTQEALSTLNTISCEIKNELIATEPNLRIDFKEEAIQDEPIDLGSSGNIINFLYLMNSGPERRNLSLDGLVINSNNLAVIKTLENKIQVSSSTRSSITSLKKDITNKSELLSKIFGFSFHHRSDYPGWEYVKDSPLRRQMMEAYKIQTGKDAELAAIHAGLECGILKEKKSDLDIVAIGPTAFGAHTPEERLNLESFNRVWEFLKIFLENS